MRMDSPLQIYPLVTAPSVDYMARFPLPNALQRSRCMTDGQLTPPPSPEDVYQLQAKPRSLPKFRLPYLVTKRSSKANALQQQFVPESIIQNQVITEIEPTSPQIFMPNAEIDEQPDYTSSSCIVEHMSNSFTTQAVPTTDLRRISQSYHNLRGIARKHDEEMEKRAIVESRVHSPLLPSPMMDDRKRVFENSSKTPLMSRRPRRLTHDKRQSIYKSYDDMQILSCYEDIRNPDVDETAFHMAGNTIPYKKYPTEFEDQNSESAEADWLANTTSHEQRLRKFNARCYQIVQQPCQPSKSRYDNEVGKVMLATVVVGPGKPKLIHIHRPSSSNISVQTSQLQSSGSVLSLEPLDTSRDIPPSTPIHQLKEVSAFSPYDTPSVVTPFTDISRATHATNRSPVEQTPISASKLDLVPRPLSISRPASSGSDGTMFSSTERRLRTLAKNFSFSPSAFIGKSVFSRSTTTTTWDIDEAEHYSSAQLSVQVSPNASRAVEQQLSTITAAIDEFPHNILDLHSPAVSDIRMLPTEEKNQLHLKHLSKVFVGAPMQLLSILAAWIIVDSYVASVCIRQDSPHPTPVHSSNTRAKGPQIPKRSASLGTTKISLRSYDSFSYSLFPVPPAATSISDESQPTSPESLHSIPSKARYLLGINPSSGWHVDNQILQTRAKALSLSIGVIAQKLVEAIKGEGGWDPYLWRALGVVVAMVEEDRGDCV